MVAAGPGTHGDGSRLPWSERLNGSGMCMVDSLEARAHVHAHLFHATLPSQDNIKGHRQCYGKRKRHHSASISRR